MVEFVTEAVNFSIWDYVVFGVILGISAGIGLYHACTGGKQATKEEFLLAGKSMSSLPIALSVLASFFSASTLLGTPAEVYQQGVTYWLSVFGAVLAPLLGAFLFGPFFHRMKLISVFEYLEKRFKSKAVRLLGGILFIFKSVLGMGIVLFGPSVALNAVTGFPVWATIVLVGLVCTFYTALGGMKAVIWTDVFQTVIMLSGMLAIIIQGCIEVGGFEKVWKIASDGGRINFFNFDPDPTVRHTFWTLIVGNFFGWLPPYTVDQQMIQRFSSATSLKQATMQVDILYVTGALLLNIPGMFIIITLCCLTGLIMYAYYAECDPILQGVIDDPNQLLPRFCMDILSHAPGVPGLFVSCLFSGALSSVSSMLNSLAAVTWQDFCLLNKRAQGLSERSATLINKAMSAGYAAIGIGMAFVFSNIGGTVLQMSLAFNGAVGAPLVGIFILGAFFPCVNWQGAFSGGVAGFVLSMWISIGAYVTSPEVTIPMNFSTAACPVMNTSNEFYSTTEIALTFTTEETDGIDKLYTLSYLWYTAVGILATLFVGLIVSFITGEYFKTSVVLLNGPRTQYLETRFIVFEFIAHKLSICPLFSSVPI
ncbi:hypothetical protein CAPTEDRAFT_91387 [Capitella teleta]|uniref:Sodium-coupled monocarboxylate transporter 1 n=1 Tax=Capitella teleta TaxID=283909 RepID=R7T6Q9_CAPTE|nr:hypothetical protein CAPTEDRAFT_91387 [Capitella teleta]|eukprot:ELT89215.1 hypothetical protein CAPTEDRAFT_91387 [Capitella teleta]